MYLREVSIYPEFWGQEYCNYIKLNNLTHFNYYIAATSSLLHPVCWGNPLTWLMSDRRENSWFQFVVFWNSNMSLYVMVSIHFRQWKMSLKTTSSAPISTAWTNRNVKAQILATYYISILGWILPPHFELILRNVCKKIKTSKCLIWHDHGLPMSPYSL